MRYSPSGQLPDPSLPPGNSGQPGGNWVELPSGSIEQLEAFAASRRMHRGVDETDDQWYGRIRRLMTPAAPPPSVDDVSGRPGFDPNYRPTWERTLFREASSEECFHPEAFTSPAAADAFYRAHPQCTPTGWHFTSPDPKWWVPWAVGGGVVVGGLVILRVLSGRGKR